MSGQHVERRQRLGHARKQHSAPTLRHVLHKLVNKFHRLNIRCLLLSNPTDKSILLTPPQDMSRILAARGVCTISWAKCAMEEYLELSYPERFRTLYGSLESRVKKQVCIQDILDPRVRVNCVAKTSKERGKRACAS